MLDPETGRLRVATAGHLPPTIISDTGTTVVDLTPGAPLGGFPYGSCPEHEISLRTGETIVLYTDGLVERRGNSTKACGRSRPSPQTMNKPEAPGRIRNR